MRKLIWSEEKSRSLMADRTRDISFQEIADQIAGGGLIADIAHPNIARYPNQRVFVIRFHDYIYAVPYVTLESGDVFLKTAFPSRALKKLYDRKDRDDASS